MATYVLCLRTGAAVPSRVRRNRRTHRCNLGGPLRSHLLRGGVDNLDELADHRGGVEIDTSRLSAVLLQLEVKDLVRQAPGMMFVRRGDPQRRTAPGREAPTTESEEAH